MRIRRVTVHPYRLAMVRPVVTARGRFTHRQGMLVALWAGDDVGVGDAAPWPGFSTLTSAALQVALQRWAPALLGATVENLADVGRLTGAALPSEARYAVETALLDLLGQAAGRPLAALLAPSPAALAPRVPVSAVVDHPRAAADAVAAGFATLKVKLGGAAPAKERARVEAIRRVAGPGVALRLDANRAWPAADAARHIAALAPSAPEWIEEPVAMADGAGGELGAGLASLAALRGSGVALAADESVAAVAASGCEPAAAVAILRVAADLLVIKPMFCGGLLRSFALAQAAREAGMGLCIGGAWESAVGRAAALHLAACFGDQPTAAGLGSVVAEDLASLPLSGGALVLPQRGGLGIDVLLPAAVAVDLRGAA